MTAQIAHPVLQMQTVCMQSNTSIKQPTSPSPLEPDTRIRRDKSADNAYGPHDQVNEPYLIIMVIVIIRAALLCITIHPIQTPSEIAELVTVHLGIVKPCCARKFRLALLILHLSHARRALSSEHHRRVRRAVRRHRTAERPSHGRAQP
jgi:hypothetical protein